MRPWGTPSASEGDARATISGNAAPAAELGAASQALSKPGPGVAAKAAEEKRRQFLAAQKRAGQI